MKSSDGREDLSLLGGQSSNVAPCAPEKNKMKNLVRIGCLVCGMGKLIDKLLHVSH